MANATFISLTDKLLKLINSYNTYAAQYKITQMKDERRFEELSRRLKSASGNFFKLRSDIATFFGTQSPGLAQEAISSLDKLLSTHGVDKQNPRDRSYNLSAFKAWISKYSSLVV